jgi:hypothetical protein
MDRGELPEVPKIVYEVLDSPGQPLDEDTRAFMEPRFGHDFSRVRVYPSARSHLRVGPPDDSYEREADHVADRVMRRPEPTAAQETGIGPVYDFSHIRIHADAKASESARAVNAAAYTVGSHIVFGGERYVPHTTAGRGLLAHELAHVVQQEAPGMPRQVIRRTTFQDCTTAQEATIGTATGIAAGFLGAAIAALAADPLAPQTRDALWLAYRDDSRATARTVSGRLSAIVGGLPGATIECEQPSDTGYDFFCGGADAYVRIVAALLGTGHIHLCMGSWDSASATDRAHTLIHEGSHRFNATSDEGYFNSPDCTESADTAPLGPVSRLDNADSYACFVMMVVTGNAAALATERADFSGTTTLEIRQTPAGAIDLNATSPRHPLFTVHRATEPALFSRPGFLYRWVIRDSDDRRYLMVGLGGEQVFQFGEHSVARIGLATRALLKQRGIRSAEILCRVQIPRVGDRLLTLPVTFTA